MIAALAKGAQALNEPKYAQGAVRAADFILNTLRQKDETLFRRYRLVKLLFLVILMTMPILSGD